MKVIVKDLDQTRIRYEAMVQQVGEGKAALAFSRALNHEGRKTFTAVKRALSKQTHIPPSMIAAAMKFRSSSKNHLRTIIAGSGKELPLRLFSPRQVKAGVKAKVWGRFQTYGSAFIVKSIGGNVFHRTGKFGKASKGRYAGQRREGIEKMYGPSIAKEMVKDETPQVFERSGNDIMDRAMHELSRILKV